AGEKGLGLPPILLIVDSLTAAQLADCVHRNVVSVLPHSACTPAALSEHIRVTADGGSLIPPALLAELLRQSHAEPTDGGPERQLTERDITVLQLLADGADTQGIAEHLNCSERTAKHITATINRRLRARNRPHAVALAIRTGIL
uniref:helix-turn-helix transcriptional regulator n=1 Tax=Actinoplanes sp. RD1 TaxID=3064538 RepID=UPI002740CD94